MFKALDLNGNIVYADFAEKKETFSCQSCRGNLRLKRGPYRKAHFAHLPESNCAYGVENAKENKTEWHRRMQEYFPREAQEYYFQVDVPDKHYIADVFLEESNTVLEFQHSTISREDFVNRTLFHAKHKRRIVWLFDESSNCENRDYGRFRIEEESYSSNFTCYKWLGNPRKILNEFPELKKYHATYSVCVYTGVEGDVFHRLVDHDYYEAVWFSNKIIEMKPDMDVEQFFEYDDYWVQQDMVASRREILQQQPMQYRTIQRKTPRKAVWGRRRRF